jgi:hypothetical protein
METTDPVAALASKDIAERAAGCRDLSLAGTVEHLELLCHHIGMDRSPGVRLSAAVAAGDILSRCRVGDARKTLSDDQRDVYVAMFSKVDPSLNAGIFPVLACLDRPQSFQMIKGGLRDPRRDVRLGAAVGLMRLCISVSVADDTDFEESVVALLADTRHQPDAIAQIARVCAAAGFSGATEFIRHIQLSGTHAEMVMEALGVLDGGQHPLQGLWYSDGKDAGETNLDSPQGPAVAVFADSGTYLNEGKRWEKKTKWEISRRMFARRVGEQEPGPSFQADGRTFYAGLGAIVDELVGADVHCWRSMVGWPMWRRPRWSLRLKAQRRRQIAGYCWPISCGRLARRRAPRRTTRSMQRRERRRTIQKEWSARKSASRTPLIPR